jgi:hypothetical protein
MTFKTVVYAGVINQSRGMLSEIFDDSNVISASRISKAEINESIFVRSGQIINP